MYLLFENLIIGNVSIDVSNISKFSYTMEADTMVEHPGLSKIICIFDHIVPENINLNVDYQHRRIESNPIWDNFLPRMTSSRTCIELTFAATNVLRLFICGKILSPELFLFIPRVDNLIKLTTHGNIKNKSKIKSGELHRFMIPFKNFLEHTDGQISYWGQTH